MINKAGLSNSAGLNGTYPHTFHVKIVTKAVATTYPAEGEYWLLWNTFRRFSSLCDGYLAAHPFPEPVRSEQSELSVSPVPSPARWSSEWPHHWPQMTPGGPLYPRVGLVETSVELKVSAEDEVGGIGTQIPPASPTCYS